MADNLNVERRGWDRKSQKLTVSFKVTGEAGERMGKITDLTLKGAGFETRGSIPVGASISLRVLGGGPARTYRATVRWTASISMNGDYHIGVKFVEEAPKADAPKPVAPTAPLPVIKVSKEEHRRFPRRAVKILVKLRCVTSGIEHEQVERGGFLVNISKSGLEIVTTRDYAAGALLAVVLPESELGPPRILHAKVAWSKPGEQAGRVHVGAGFVKLSAPVPPEGI